MKILPLRLKLSTKNVTLPYLSQAATQCTNVKTKDQFASRLRQNSKVVIYFVNYVNNVFLHNIIT